MPHCGSNEYLEKLLSDGDINKVGIGIKNDATKLANDWNIRLNGHIDLGEYYNRLFNIKETWGLQSLCKKVLGCHLNKGKMWQRKWHISPLKQDEIDYAATDAWVGIVMYEVITKLAPTLS